ncbi:MAG: hypothetical protein LJE68_12220 [Rhodobacter sp.]|nr:hypothetical protein [Rhodobacter sp.]
MVEFYEYRTGGRQPFVIGCYTAAFAMLFLTAAESSSLVLWGLSALVTLALCYHLVGQPVAGSRIDATHWTTFIDFRSRSIALDQIARVTLTVPGNCRYGCTLTLLDGSTRRVSPRCLPPPPTLSRALRRRKVPLEILRNAPRTSRALATTSTSGLNP